MRKDDLRVHLRITTVIMTAPHPLLQAAIDALARSDRSAWMALFTPNATFSDDGRPGPLAHFTESAFGKGREHFTRIDKVENGGLDVYGHYHSDTWGDFTTFFKVKVHEGRITQLDVGQADY